MNAPLRPLSATAREFGHDALTLDRVASEHSARIVELAAVRSARRAVATGAAIMVREPWRIVRAVYPFAPTVWPIPGKPMTEVLADCSRMVRTHERMATSQPRYWAYDVNRHVALRQAEDALLALITGDAPEPNEAA